MSPTEEATPIANQLLALLAELDAGSDPSGIIRRTGALRVKSTYEASLYELIVGICYDKLNDREAAKSCYNTVRVMASKPSSEFDPLAMLAAAGLYELYARESRSKVFADEIAGSRESRALMGKLALMMRSGYAAKLVGLLGVTVPASP